METPAQTQGPAPIPSMDPKNIRKMAKKFQNDPNMRKMMEAFMPKPDLSKPADERLRERINQSRLDRGGAYRRQVIADKKDEKAEKDKTEAPVDTTTPGDGVSGLDQTVKDLKKKHQTRIRKLRKKYGTVSHEQWVQALHEIDHAQELHLSEDRLQQQKNLVELYNHHVKAHTPKEAVLDDSSDEEDDKHEEDREDREDHEDREDREDHEDHGASPTADVSSKA
jgi:hypothetical protein